MQTRQVFAGVEIAFLANRKRNWASERRRWQSSRLLIAWHFSLDCYPSVESFDDACPFLTPCRILHSPVYLSIYDFEFSSLLLLVRNQRERRHTMPLPQPELPEPAHPTVDSMLSRKFGKEVANYFSGNSQSIFEMQLSLTHPRIST
jgi:hypothetical protein